jgi:hypothetical protein
VPELRARPTTPLVSDHTCSELNHFLTVGPERELDFERDMDNRDARENARQEAADLRIDGLAPHQRATAEEQEERIRQAFDDDQRQRRHQHEAALAAAVHRLPVPGSTGAGCGVTRP